MRSVLVVFMLVSASWGVAAQADDAPGTRLIVYHLNADDTLRDLAVHLSQELVVHLSAHDDLVVTSEDEVRLQLEHQKDRAALGCSNDEQCLRQLAAIVDSDKIITGHLGKLGRQYVVSLKLANPAEAVVERTESASAESRDELSDLVKRLASRLVGRESAESPRFRLEIASEGLAAAVLDLSAQGLDDSVAENLTQLLALELKRFEGVSVISRDEIKAMVRFETQKQTLQGKCDTSCLAKIVGALGVDYLVGGSVAKMGREYFVHLKLMDVRGARVVNRVTEAFQGTPAQLGQAMRMAVWALLGRTARGKGKLRVDANVSDASVVLNAGRATTLLETKGRFDGLGAGKHALSFNAEGYYPHFQHAYVEQDQTSVLDVSMTELPRPWYKKWWPWTIIGTVVVGGGITAWVLLTQEPESATVDVVLE